MEQRKQSTSAKTFPYQGFWVRLGSAKAEPGAAAAEPVLRWREGQWSEEVSYNPFDHYHAKPESRLRQESLHLAFAGLARRGHELLSFQVDLLVPHWQHPGDTRAQVRRHS